jgi:signal transduction histidine kinase
MYLAFGAFIVLCGATHFFDIWVIWNANYWLDGSLRAATAFVSVGTAVLLPPLLPHAENLARGARAARERGIELETAVIDLETMYQRTKELEQLKSQFFANVSHELRTPLALILGPVEKLLASADISTEQRWDLEIVLRNAKTLHRHVDDLLDAAKLEAGKLAPEYAEVDVAELVRLVASNFDGLAAQHEIDFSTTAPASLTAQLDANKLERVVLNLLSNAFKFTPAKGRIVCKLALLGGANEPRFSISVADSGPGIPAAQRLLIFERFRQLDGGSTRVVGGTGLGLTIAKDFVELQRGWISVEDAEEGGAMFMVNLPVSALPGTELGAAPKQSGREQTALAREALPELRPRLDSLPPVSVVDEGRALVLVVEDNPEMNRFICEALSVEFRTAAAFDGHTGLSQALALQPDLVLTDVMMPGLSGDELVRELRARPEMNRVPIVLLTAKADDALRLQLLRKGAQDYLTKPFSIEELRARVGNLVALKRAQDVLIEAKASTEMANRELEAFSYSVSHDLRAPLRGLDGYSQALLEDYADRLDPEGASYLHFIRAAAQRMGRLIDDLLQLSRVTRADLRRDEVDLSSIARTILGNLKQLAPERDVEVIVPAALVAQGDVRLIEVVLGNLLGNAWKFTNKRAQGRIELGSRREASSRVFFVRDNGAGFDATCADKLFGAFQRLHSDREFEGTGIGLATVQRIVHRHGGQIWADATVDVGATFYFTLPSSGHGANA